MTVDNKETSGDRKASRSGQSPGSDARHLYRHGSLAVNLQHVFDETSEPCCGNQGVAMTPVSHRSKVTSSHGQLKNGIRSRASSAALSVRSRKASRAEYHNDLKPSLHHGLTRNLLFMSFVILMSTSFQFGYNIGVLNQPEQLIKEFYNKTYVERLGHVDGVHLTVIWAVTTTIFFLPGGMFGAFCAGYVADRAGRKKAILIGNIPAIIGAVLSAICVRMKLPELLLVGRLLTGVSCGMATQLAPLFLAEITPFNLRGAFGTANQLFITIGICVSNLMGLREIFGTSELWSYLLLFNIGPSILCLLVLPCFPDSPRYLLIKRNEHAAAIKALKFLRQNTDVSADLEEMETECHDNVRKYSMLTLLRTRELWKPLLVTVVLQIVQQLSGINAIFFYSTSIFKNAGVPGDAIQFAVLLTSIVNVAMTIVAVPAMDRAGRRPLLLYPMALMVVILGVITAALKYQGTWPWMSYVSIVCFIAYVVCFALGLGPIPMMITAELFRQAPRPRAMSLAGAINWLFTALVALGFPILQMLIKEYTFLIFFFLMILFTIFVYNKVPETKNKTFEEIASEFQPGDELEVEEVIEDDVFDPVAMVTRDNGKQVDIDDRAGDGEKEQSHHEIGQTYWSVRL